MGKMSGAPPPGAGRGVRSVLAGPCAVRTSCGPRFATTLLYSTLLYRSGRPDLYGRGGTGTLVPVYRFPARPRCTRKRLLCLRTSHGSSDLYRSGGALTCTNFGPANPPTPSKRRQGYRRRRGAGMGQPARPGLRERRRGSAGLLHEVRLQRGGHQSHRRHQQAGFEELLMLGGGQGARQRRGDQAHRRPRPRREGSPHRGLVGLSSNF